VVKTIKTIIIAIGAAFLFIIGLFAGSKRTKRQAADNRIINDIDRIGDRQSEIDEQFKRSDAGADRVEEQLQDSSTIINHSEARIRRAKDILAEIKRRQDKTDHPDEPA